MAPEKPHASFIARIMGETKWARWFSTTALMQAVSLCLLEGLVLYLHQGDAKTLPPDDELHLTFRSLLVYHILFIMAQLFQQVLVFDALRAQNFIQIIAVGGFNLLILAYSVVQSMQTRKLYDSMGGKSAFAPVYVAEYVIVGLSFVFTTTLSSMSFKLYREFGWTIYKTIGADLRMRDIFKNYLILVLLLKLDVFFFLGFSFQFVALAIEESDRTLHICLAGAASLVLLVSASAGLRHENKPAMLVFLAGCFPTLGYMLYKLASAFTEVRFEKFRIFITLFLGCSIALSVITILLSWRAYKNFGEGLLTHLQSRRKLGRSSSRASSTLSDIPLEDADFPPSKRWSID